MIVWGVQKQHGRRDQKAYRKRKKYHPDINRSLARGKNTRIQEAYETLSDDQKTCSLRPV